MSFTNDVKSELVAVHCAKCCQRSQLYAMMYFAGRFDRNEIRLSTESIHTAELFEKLLKRVFGVQAKAGMRESFGKRVIYDISVAKDNAPYISEGFGYTAEDEPTKLIRAVFDRQCCLKSFIRGAFLCCGSLQNPQKGYRLEFSLTDKAKRDTLKEILFENGFDAISGNRKDMFVLYFKGSEQIETLLALMGATNSYLQLINEKIYRDIRNNENRKSNCDVANISKTLLASEKHIKAIEKIKKAKAFDTLPDELKTVAQLRIDNPDLPLSELRTMTNPPLSRSGINHRLQKIVEIAQDL